MLLSLQLVWSGRVNSIFTRAPLFRLPPRISSEKQIIYDMFLPKKFAVPDSGYSEGGDKLVWLHVMDLALKFAFR